MSYDYIPVLIGGVEHTATVRPATLDELMAINHDRVISDYDLSPYLPKLVEMGQEFILCRIKRYTMAALIDFDEKRECCEVHIMVDKRSKMVARFLAQAIIKWLSGKKVKMVYTYVDNPSGAKGNLSIHNFLIKLGFTAGGKSIIHELGKAKAQQLFYMHL